MRVNSFYDSWLFLIGETGPHLGVGGRRYLLVALFWGLLLGSAAVAIRNWRADPLQRTGVHLGTWACRVVIGTMWFEGALWKLPIPSGGFRYWLEQEAQHAAFAFHREFVTAVLLPNFTVVNVVAFLAGMGMAASLTMSDQVHTFTVYAYGFSRLWRWRTPRNSISGSIPIPTRAVGIHFHHRDRGHVLSLRRGPEPRARRAAAAPGPSGQERPPEPLQ